MHRWGILCTCLIVLILAACAEQTRPEETVERYLRAKVSGDAQTVERLLCSEMESMRVREQSAFSTVSAEIENMRCEAASTGAVSCTGEIVAAYGTENISFPLATYRVVREDDGWKWCGEAR